MDLGFAGRRVLVVGASAGIGFATAALLAREGAALLIASRDPARIAAAASLVSSTRVIELDAAVWSNNTVRVMARNISATTFDLAAATLSVQVVKRRVP